MGYDCHIVDKTGKSIDTFEKTPNEDPRWADDRRMDNDPGYFRRNIWGMGNLRKALESIGMGFWAAGLDGQFPSFEDVPEYPQGDGHWGGEWEDDPLSDEAKAYDAANLAVLRNQFDERPGIPLHKTCDNSGWWITEHECAAALDIWERAGSPMPESFYTDFIPYLRLAAQHGGFRVY